MRLARLTLNGFKSFADRTVFRFDDPIIGIVGPNGCGKSNVVDAVKWVLGERSAKSLRGEQMLDVIFGGTTHRPPAPMAEVILSFENPLVDDNSGQRELAVNTDVVDIGRRLYRDGKSEYLINNRIARLRDIRELFMDTGVGADAYSIIEQGKVDAMLTSNPMERRTIFEEAAGVAKFKLRRTEAMRKLERTEMNLVRCREQLDSAERRLRIVRSQANKARQFKELDAELRDLRTAHALDEYHDLRETIAGLTSELSELGSKRTELGNRLAEIEDNKQVAELDRQKLSRARSELDQDRLQQTARHDQAVQRREMTLTAQQEAIAELEQDRKRREDLDSRCHHLADDLEEQSELDTQLAQAVEESASLVSQCVAQRDACQSQVSAHAEQIEQARRDLAGMDREKTGLAVALESVIERIGTIDEQSDKLAGRSRALAERMTECEAQIADLDTKRQHLEESLLTSEQDLLGADRDAESLDGTQRDISRRLSRAEHEQARMDSRRHTLEEMQQSGEGLTDAVRQVLEDRQSGDSPFAAVQGVLADAITADMEYAPVLESALGPLLQALLIDRDDLKAIGSTDLATLTGRVTFLPLTPRDHRGRLSGARAGDLRHIMRAARRDSYRRLRSGTRLRAADLRDLSLFPAAHRPNARFKDGTTRITGAIRRAARQLNLSVSALADHIEITNADAAPLVEQLLAGIFVVETIDAAQSLIGHLGHRVGSDAHQVRFVTRAGDVIHLSGHVTAGPSAAEGSGAGLISRRTELSVLADQIERLDRVIASEREALADIDEKAAAIDARRAAARQHAFQLRAERDKNEHASEHLKAEIAQLRRETASIASELEAIGIHKSKMLEEQADRERRIESLSRLIEEQQLELDGLEASTGELSEALLRASESVTSARVEAGQTAERRNAVQRERRRLELALQEARGQWQVLKDSMKHRESKLVEYERTIDDAAFTIEETQTFLQDSESDLAGLAEQLKDMQSRCEQLGEQLVGVREQAGVIERNYHALEVSKREAEVKREHLEQRTQEDLDFELADEYVAYKVRRTADDFEPIDRASTMQRIGDLRETIRKLGNINLDAIEEEQSLEQRNEDLVNQVADLDQARERLTALIDQLNVVSRERLEQTFETIRENFAGKTGTFRKLFGGGRADIVFMPDENGNVDWLESGIEIIAKPPGKEPRSIKLLSGGEKTMTSVALLLAIFQSKPSPFCLLDEVDAALDDANVERFAGVLSSFLDRSHFIIITHNKRTMLTADQLYGITMQERGISTRVAVRLDQIGEGGKIHKSAFESDTTPEPIEAVTPTPPADPVPANGSGKTNGTRKAASLADLQKTAVEVLPPDTGPLVPESDQIPAESPLNN